MRTIKQPELKDWPPYVFFQGEFSKAECETIMHVAKGLRPERGITGASAPNAENVDVRSSQVSWLSPSPENDWIFERLANTCAKVQKAWYPFSLSGFAEPIQLTRYRASEGGHYETHRDFGPGTMSTRKLSIVALLNDPSEFEGGELDLLAIPGDEKKVSELGQGTVVAFPAWELHRVRRVTQGERWSLVSWIHGHPFS
jgi:PKHD-type hydroxylase